MEDELKKLKVKYLETKPSDFLKKEGMSNLWERIDAPNPHREFFPRYLAIILALLAGFAGLISVTYAAEPGTALYEVKKAAQDVVRHVPIVSSVIPDEQPTPTPTSTPGITPTVNPSTTPQSIPSIDLEGGNENEKEGSMERDNRKEDVKGAEAINNNIEKDKNLKEDKNSSREELQEHSPVNNTRKTED